MKAYSGKSVLITGASMGIGKACSIKFAKEGVKVYINYKSNDKIATATLHEVNQWSGGLITTFVALDRNQCVDWQYVSVQPGLFWLQPVHHPARAGRALHTLLVKKAVRSKV